MKQLRDALADFTSANRIDLVEKTKIEIALLESYLPKQLSDEELEAVVQEILRAETSPPTEVGKIVGKVMTQVRGRADGNRVREIVTRLIAP